jgi:O-succinylbenzoate synthase
MKILKIHARELAMSLISPFETSFGVMQNRRILLIELVTDQATGWGELTAAEAPFYNSETTDTGWLILRKYIAPTVLGRDFSHPDDLSVMMQSIRGHEMIKAAVETAAWDAFARAQNASLASILGATQAEIACGVSLGIHADIDVLLARIERELASGYQRVKLKIKPGKDVEVVRAVREVYPEIALTVDANSAYSVDDIELLKQLDQFELDYIEQPLQWNEIYAHAELQRQLSTPLCLDESIHGLRDAQAAVKIGACKVINIKLGRVSGHTEARLIQAFCESEGIPVWSGGMLEAGIGRAHNIAMSALPGFIFPGDVSASARYWSRDILETPVEVTKRGTIHVPTGPGIGFNVDLDTVREFTTEEYLWEI